MTTRKKVIIAIALGVAVVALIVFLISCNKKAPDTSFSQANNLESEVTAESSNEADASSSVLLQAEESNKEDTENNEAAQTTAQQTEQTNRDAEVEGNDTDEPKPSAQATATPTPTPTTVPLADPTNATDPTEPQTTEPTAEPEPTETQATTATTTSTPTSYPYTYCLATVEYWAGNDNCYHGYVYNVPCVLVNDLGYRQIWDTTDEGEDLVWDAIAAEHPDYGGYTAEVVEGSYHDYW